MVLLMLMIIHVMITILSNFLHLHIPFNQNLLLTVKLFLPLKGYVREIIFQNKYKLSSLCFTKNKSNNTIVSLRKLIYGNVNVICYDSKDFVPPCVRYIPYNDYNKLSPLHIPMEEHDNITDENNWRESIEF